MLTVAQANKKLLEDLAGRTSAPIDVLDRLLELEPDFRNLQAHGARSQFKARIAAIIEEGLSLGAPKAQ